MLALYFFPNIEKSCGGVPAQTSNAGRPFMTQVPPLERGSAGGGRPCALTLCFLFFFFEGFELFLVHFPQQRPKSCAAPLVRLSAAYAHKCDQEGAQRRKMTGTVRAMRTMHAKFGVWAEF